MEKQSILTERNVVVEVLKKYRKLPYLWNPTHKLYTNKNARREGLEIMLKSWRKLEPKATIECMRKKLNNWRAAYRRERKKVEDSLETSSDPDEIHKPNLWYYEYLTFIHDDCPVLKDDDINMTGTEMMSDEINEDEGGTTGSKTVNEIDNDKDGCSDDGEDDDPFDDDDVSIRDDNDEEETLEVPEKKTRLSIKRTVSDRLLLDQVLINSNSNDESSADLFGRAIGSQLKEVSKYQRCLAEKLISEIMFYAKLEQLTIKTSVSLDSSES